MCKQAHIDCQMVNATNQRGRLSTLFAALDISPEDRQYFYSHMGHSSQVNAGTSQRPLPIMAITKVGRHLTSLDRGSGKRKVQGSSGC